MGGEFLRKTHWRLDGKPFSETWLSWSGKRERSESRKQGKRIKNMKSAGRIARGSKADKA